MAPAPRKKAYFFKWQLFVRK